MWTHVDVFGRGSLVREREQARASAVSELVAVLAYVFYLQFGYTAAFTRNTIFGARAEMRFCPAVARLVLDVNLKRR